MDTILLYEAIACEREMERERALLIRRARSAIAVEPSSACRSARSRGCSLIQRPRLRRLVARPARREELRRVD
jgi:hypothetical protein